MNCCNKASYIESSVDKAFGLGSTLSVPYVNPNDGYVQFGGYFDDPRFRYQNNIVKDMIAFQNSFDVI